MSLSGINVSAFMSSKEHTIIGRQRLVFFISIGALSIILTISSFFLQPKSPTLMVVDITTVAVTLLLEMLYFTHKINIRLGTTLLFILLQLELSAQKITFATINTNDGYGGVNGVLLFPDGVTIDNSEASSWGNINDKSEWGTKCTSSQWTALEDKGCVFLPVTGYRTTHEINQWWRGFYWSSSPTQSQAYRALCVNFADNYLKLPDEYWYRCWAASVRLVMDVR